MFTSFMHDNSSQAKFEGKLLPGIVANNNDPNQLGALQIRISTLHNNIMDVDLPWSLPCTFTPQGFAPGIGALNVPVIGARVLVFECEDDDNHGHYIGDYPDSNCKITELLVDYPSCYGYADAAGNLFIVNTQLGTVNFIQGVTGAWVGFDASGGLDFYSPTYIKMKAPIIYLDGNVTMGSSVNSGLVAKTRAKPTPQTFSNKVNY